MKTLLLLVFLSVIVSGYGLKCWECTGSDEDCSETKLAEHKDERLKTCDEGMDSCIRTWAEADGKTGIVSSCSTKSLCEAAKDVCEKSGDCKVGCCDSDECNASSALSFSVILMAACSVLGLALLK